LVLDAGEQLVEFVDANARLGHLLFEILAANQNSIVALFGLLLPEVAEPGRRALVGLALARLAHGLGHRRVVDLRLLDLCPLRHVLQHRTTATDDPHTFERRPSGVAHQADHVVHQRFIVQHRLKRVEAIEFVDQLLGLGGLELVHLFVVSVTSRTDRDDVVDVVEDGSSHRDRPVLMRADRAAAWHVEVTRDLADIGLSKDASLSHAELFLERCHKVLHNLCRNLAAGPHRPPARRPTEGPPRCPLSHQPAHSVAEALPRDLAKALACDSPTCRDERLANKAKRQEFDDAVQATGERGVSYSRLKIHPTLAEPDER